jgi:1,2-diacylglycerol 3-beta-glucosyltransferase
MAAGGRTTDHRRGKSALFLIGCGWAGMAPHWLHESLRLIPALTLAVLLGGYSLRTVLRQVFGSLGSSEPAQASAPQGAEPLPAVDVVVAARDEQAVIGRLV